jgi:Na+(H+)/acetate symporter ActP
VLNEDPGLHHLRCLEFSAVLNLGFIGIGAVSAQGLPAGTMAPVYGTTWAAAQAPSHRLNAPTMASEPSKIGRVEAPRIIDIKAGHLARLEKESIQ